jgi:lipopolysaccharide biosynthesis regulator YciM
MSASRLAEDTTRTNRYSSMLEREVKAEIATAPTDQRELSDLYSVLLNVYETRKDYTSAIDMLTKLQEQYPDDQRIKNQIQIYQNMMNAQQASSDTTTK